MPIDRDATLKKAEKLLRQGKLDGAIAEYVRLVEEFPKDWNLINALGDLYGRAGQIDNAAAQFGRIADHLYGEGFMPKAAALYKKILRIKADDEHTLLRLAELATRQGVFVDAKNYYRQVAERRRQKGNQAGAAEIVITLGEIDPNDAEAKLQAARAAQSLNDSARACDLLIAAADVYEKQKKMPDALAALTEALVLDPESAPLRSRLLSGLIGQGQIDVARKVAQSSAELLPIAEVLERDGKKAEALEVLSEAARLDPGNLPLRARMAREWVAAGDLVKARQFLNAETAAGDPDLLMILARMELTAGRLEQGKAALHQLLAVRPDQRNDLVLVGCELADQGKADAAFACVDLVADAALLEEDWGGAAAALHEFVTRVPNQVPALMKLVEICVDGGLESTMYMAQAQLADAYLAAGMGTEARVIAEDLVAREPWQRANIERFRRALMMLGVNDPDGIIAERLSGESPFLSTIDLDDDRPAEPTTPPILETAFTPPPPPPPSPSPLPPPSIDLADFLPVQGEISLEPVEVDLTDALAGFDAPAPPLQDIFDDMRNKASRDSQLQDAQAAYTAGIDHASHGRVDEAISAFETAARVPILRFHAGARLGRLHIAHGDVVKGVEWLERAAQAPAPNPDEGHALMFELADALEHLGENARALAILMELSTHAAGYRDVNARIDRLSKVQARG